MANGIRKTMERLARVGYLAKGVVYITAGLLSVEAALQGGAPEGGHGAIRQIGQQPFGMVLLVVTAAGLAAYALWRGVQASLDPEQVGDGLEGAAKRVGYAASGLSYGALCVWAVQLITGSGASSGGSKQTYVAALMTSDLGRVLIILAGVALIGVGLRQLYKAKTTEFSRKMALSRMSARARKAAIWMGRFGLAARGVVFPIMGYFLIRSSIQTQPSQVKGLGGALREVASSTHGSILLLIVAAGLMAYGVYQLALARYRRISA